MTCMQRVYEVLPTPPFQNISLSHHFPSFFWGCQQCILSCHLPQMLLPPLCLSLHVHSDKEKKSVGAHEWQQLLWKVSPSRMAEPPLLQWAQASQGRARAVFCFCPYGNQVFHISS